MALVRSFEEAQLNQKQREKIDSTGSPGVTTNIPFFGSRDTPDAPHAFVTKWNAAWVSGPHFHENDQFQVIVDGRGRLGRHSLVPYSVHFSGAYTPYGPLAAAVDSPMSFLVMRPRYDAGSQRLPKQLEKLKAVPNRRPLQITRPVSFPPLRAVGNIKRPMIKAMPELRNDNGLAGHTLHLKAGASAQAPDPSNGGGQFLVIVAGSLLYGAKEYKALTLVFVAWHESPFELRAGRGGLQALVLDFPRAGSQPSVANVTQATSARRWQCQFCGFAYDESLGLPHDGIAPGTRWEDIPESWNCPDCSALKSDFKKAAA